MLNLLDHDRASLLAGNGTVLARLRAKELWNLSLDHLDVVKFNFVLESGCQFERGPDFTLTTPSITPFILPDRGS